LFFVLPHISLERIVQVFVGEDRKSRSSDCFSVLASLSIHRFDLALHMMSFPYCMFCFLVFYFKKKKKIGENLQDFYFSLGISDIACVFT
jgi:Ca2+/Na+ antiporter